MLYAKEYINKEKRKLLEILKCIKESFLDLLIVFNSFNSFTLFLKQKFHF